MTDGLCSHGDYIEDGTGRNPAICAELLADDEYLAAQTRHVIRDSAPYCSHPTLTDAAILAAVDGPAYASGLFCPEQRSYTTREGVVRTYTCGWIYPYENRDGDVALYDEPAGAGL